MLQNYFLALNLGEKIQIYFLASEIPFSSKARQKSVFWNEKR